MLIEYAINYYCRTRLQSFILRRMYGGGYRIDVVPESTLTPLLTFHCVLCAVCEFYMPGVCLVSHITDQTATGKLWKAGLKYAWIKIVSIPWLFFFFLRQQSQCCSVIGSSVRFFSSRWTNRQHILLLVQLFVQGICTVNYSWPHEPIEEVQEFSPRC